MINIKKYAEYVEAALNNEIVPDKLDDNLGYTMTIYANCLNTYIAKNIDYGDSFAELYQKFGLLSTVIRLNDKIKRLESLVDGEGEVKDESVEDTLEDLINYAVMTLIEIKKGDDE